MKVGKSNSATHEISRVLSALESFYDKNPKYFSASNGQKVSYTLIRKNIFPNSRLLNLKNIFFNIENILRLKIYPNIFKLNFYCEEIIIKSNVRIQKIDNKNISVKLYMHTKNTNLENEIESRNIIKNFIPDSKIVPELIDHDSSGATWIIEEYIEMALFQFGKMRKLVSNILPQIYPATVYYKPFEVSDFAYLDRTKNETIIENNKKLREFGAEHAYVYAHGDMAKSNVLKDVNGNIIISDWENAGYAPISIDTCRLYMNYSHLRSKIIGLLDTCTKQNSKCISSQTLLALGLESYLNGIMDKTNGKLSFKQKAQDRKGRKLIARLLDYPTFR